MKYINVALGISSRLYDSEVDSVAFNVRVRILVTAT